MNLFKKLHELYLKFRYETLVRFEVKYWHRIKHRFFTHSDRAKRAAVMRLYELASGHTFDLDHPKTYNEKIQWLKLYGDLPLMTKLADKYLVRDFVREKIGEKYLVPLLGVWDSPDEIDFSALPDQFVLKANHGSGMNLIVKDKNSLDIPKAKKKMRRWLRENFAWNFMELQYANIPPKIIAEEFLQNADGDLPDYKVWCFDGKARYIMFLAERQTRLKMAFYDCDWQKQDFVYTHPQYEKNVPRPLNLEEIIEKAEILAAGFPHVRVDFYCLDDGQLKFGEMTFSALAGLCHWNPPEVDLMMGEMLPLPGSETTKQD